MIQCVPNNGREDLAFKAAIYGGEFVDASTENIMVSGVPAKHFWSEFSLRLHIAKDADDSPPVFLKFCFPSILRLIGAEQEL